MCNVLRAGFVTGVDSAHDVDGAHYTIDVIFFRRALISMAGNAVWVLGGLVPDPPIEILGAGLSSIGAFVHGGSGKNDDQLLLALQGGLD